MASPSIRHHSHPSIRHHSQSGCILSATAICNGDCKAPQSPEEDLLDETWPKSSKLKRKSKKDQT